MQYIKFGIMQIDSSGAKFSQPEMSDVFESLSLLC